MDVLPPDLSCLFLPSVTSQMFAFVWDRSPRDTRGSLARLAATWKPLLPTATVALVEATMAATALAAAATQQQHAMFGSGMSRPVVSNDPRMAATASAAMQVLPPPPPIQYQYGALGQQHPVPQVYPTQAPVFALQQQGYTSSSSSFLQQPQASSSHLSLPGPPGFPASSAPVSLQHVNLMASLQSLTNKMIVDATGRAGTGRSGDTGSGTASASIAASAGSQPRFGKIVGCLSFHPPSILKVSPSMMICSCRPYVCSGSCLSLRCMHACIHTCCFCWLLVVICLDTRSVSLVSLSVNVNGATC